MTNTDPRSGTTGGQPHNPYPAGDPLYRHSWPGAHSYPPAPAPAPAAPAKRRPLVGVAAAAVAAALVVAGVGIGREVGGGTGFAFPSQSGTSSNGDSEDSGISGGQGYFPNGSGSSGTQGGTQSANSTQQAGIVTIVSTLGYQSAAAAGTGMILTSDGEILTNNHVVNGATSIKVTVESSDKTYTADVVGTDASDDVAVLQLRDASGLTTAKVGDASDVSDLAVGDAVTGVGNANGTGTLTAAAGKVTDLEQSITASSEGGGDAEHLTGLIETNAPIVSGDSGGPLYDSDGDIVGINTAASSANGSDPSGATTASQAYAIPIDDALKIVAQIDSGQETADVQIGLPAFLGVGVAETSTGGAGITSVLEGGPADDAGITAGSTITAVGGKSVASGEQLQSRLAAYDPGDKVAVTWTDTSGQRHTATVTLATGPAA